LIAINFEVFIFLHQTILYTVLDKSNGGALFFVDTVPPKSNGGVFILQCNSFCDTISCH